MKIKHYVSFYSPGTFISEVDTKEIESWNVDLAKSMMKEIVQRHNATPYGFKFFTKTLKDNDFEPKITERSKLYLVGGKILSYKDIEERNDPKDNILLSNMKSNNWDFVWQTTKGWLYTLPITDDVIVINE